MPALLLRPTRWKAVSAAPLLALTLLAGCKPVGPNYNRPGFDAPPAYKEAGASTALIPPPNPAGGGWQPAKPRPRKVSPALQGYAAMTTSASRGAVRSLQRFKDR